MPSSSASAAACSGPAPPNAASVNSRGSWPRCTETILSASAMAWLTTSITAAAAVRASMPSGSARRLRDRGFGRGVVDRQVAAQQRALVEVAEQQVAVGDGGLGAAAAVADRARIGAGALRPDAQRAGAIDPGDRAAAGGDLGQVDHRHADRMAGAVHPAVAAGAAADLVLGRRLVLAVADQARLGGGAAHVEGEEIAAAGLPRHQRRGDDAGRRARLHGHGRHGDGLAGFEDAAVGAHHVEARQALGARRLLQALQIRREDRADVGADGRGAGALELLDLGQHLARRDRPARRQARRAGARRGCASCSGLRKLNSSETATASTRAAFSAAISGVDLGLGQRRDDRAVGADALGDLEAAVARNERRRRVLEQVVEVGAGRAAQLQHVAEAARGDERGARALLLEDGVGDDGGGMRQQADVGGGHAVALHGGLQRGEHALGQVARRGRHLGDADARRSRRRSAPRR